MHILYLLAAPGIPLGGPSGSSYHVAALVQAFADLGHRVSLCVARVAGPLPPGWQYAEAGGQLGVSAPRPSPWQQDGAGSPAGAALEGAGHGTPGGRVRVLEVPAPAAPLWARGRIDAEKRHARALAQAAIAWLGDDRPDLIYERYSLFSDAGGLVRARWSAPWMLEVNAPLRLERVRYEGLRDDRRVRAAERAILRAADRLLAVSSPLARYLVDEVGAAAERVSIVPNGVDVARFRKAAGGGASSPAHRLEQSGAARAPVIGFIGSLKPWHGLDRWVEIFARVRARVPAVRGLIVGDGPERERVYRSLQVRGLEDVVTFTGHRDPTELASYLAVMDVLLAPYPRIDPFYFCPLKVIEALAAGVPVVTTAQGDLPGLVGDAGRVAPPEDLEGLVEAVSLALIDAPTLERWRAGTGAQVAGRDWRDVAAGVVAAMNR